MKLVRKFLAVGLSVSIVLGSTVAANAYSTTLDRIQGANNYETAALVADRQGNYNAALLVNLDTSIADGLSSSGLSGAVNAPILLTKKDSIPDVTMARLIKAKKVYIIGGTNSVSPNVENSLKSKGITVNRIQGKDRIETSLNVATEIKKFNNPQYVFFTNGFKGEADAISVSFLAAQKKCPIIQTDGKSTTFKVNEDQNSWVIGGRASMSETFVNKMNSLRIGGIDRFDTNRKLVEFAYEEEAGDDESYFYSNDIHIADGYNLVNALVASPIAKYAPTVLVSKKSNKSILAYADKITVVGNLDEDTINRCMIQYPVLSDLVGSWYSDGSHKIWVDEYTFDGASYEVLDYDESELSVDLLVHYPSGDKVRSIEHEDGGMWIKQFYVNHSYTFFEKI